MKTKLDLGKLIISLLIFGSIGLFVRSTSLPSGTIALVRGIVGCLFLLGISLIGRKHIAKGILLKNIRFLLISGICLGLNWVLLFEAYKHTTIAIASVSYYLAPVFIMLASGFVLKEKITPGKLFSVLIVLLGMVMVSDIFTEQTEGSSHLIGIGFGIAAAIGYATLTLLNKFITDLTSLQTTTIQLGISAIILIPYTLFNGELSTKLFTTNNILLLLILGILHTGIAFWLYFSSIRRLSAQTISVLAYIDPITAILLSTLLLHEPLSLTQTIGSVLVLGTTFVYLLRTSKK